MTHGRSVFLYLTATPRDEDLADVRGRLFEPLLAVDPSAVLTTINVADGSDLHNLLWYVGESRWQGLLVVALPPELCAHPALAEMERPSFQWLISIRKRTLAASQFLQEPLISAMALVLKTCERRGTVVVLLESNGATTSRALVQSNEVEQRLFTVQASVVNREFYQTLRSQQDYQFATPRITAVSQMGISRTPLPPEDSHNLVPHDIYSSWAQQEFHNDRTAGAFFRVLNDAFPEIQSRLSPPTAFLPAEHQIALGALRVCRRMSTWTLEGSPFECSVMLLQNEAKASSQLYRFIPAFELSKKIPFTFNHLNEIRKAAEIVHASDLLMSVELEQGKLFRLSAAVQGGLNSRSRHELFPDWTRDHNAHFIVVHCRHGFVEVYARGGLQLWYDGFCWRVRPYDTLEEVLRLFFGDGNREAVPRFRAAIATILDLQESSILVLAAPEDVSKFDRHASFNMRQGFEPSPSARDDFSRRVSIDTIVGVLHLDGAHCVDREGKLRSWARQIMMESDASDPESAADSSSPKDGVGTGTRAAKWLSKQMPSSYVIKTSASGYIKIFHNGREYLRTAWVLGAHAAIHEP